MPDERLTNYVKEQISRGVPPETIKEALRQAGWQDSQIIEEALISAGAVPVPSNTQSVPKSSLFVTQTKLEKQSWFSVLFLSLITVGIYIPFWYRKVKRATDLPSVPSKINDKLILVLIVIAVVNVILGGHITVGDTTYGLDLGAIGKTIGTIFSYAYVIIQIVLAFLVRSVLRAQFSVNVNPIMTFIFGPLYLQTRINRVIEAATMQRSSVAPPQ
jgi:hypothetical protein